MTLRPIPTFLAALIISTTATQCDQREECFEPGREADQRTESTFGGDQPGVDQADC